MRNRHNNSSCGFQLLKGNKSKPILELNLNWISQGIMNLDSNSILLKFPNDVNHLGITDIRAILLEGQAEDSNCSAEDILTGADHLADGALGNKLAHAVVYSSARQDNLGDIADLLRLVGQIIGINTDTVTAHQARPEGKEVPLRSGCFQHVEGIDTKPVEDQGQQFSTSQFKQIRYFIGDVRDKDRLTRAMEGIDIVIHAAALKQVPACEYNPFEAIKTNVIGAQNVIESAIDRGVKQVVALSTDKACAPINLYGATKLCSDKLFVAANNFKGKRDIKFSVVRYGNVMGSRGSVIPFFMQKKNAGLLPITDEGMTRFNITLEDGVKLVLYALENMWGGEIFVPKIPSYRIMDVADAIGPECQKEVVGIRPGEKLHEEMITPTDALCSVEFEKYFVILPSINLWDVNKFAQTFGGNFCKPGFSYNSGENTEWLNVEEIRTLIRDHVDPAFEA
jgi:UDP-N-acetylglucosamine 4,6-dehydratase (inverting)